MFSTKRNVGTYFSCSALRLHTIAKFIALTFVFGLSACENVTRNALPAEYADRAQIPGIPDAREIGKRPSKVL